MLCWFFPQLQQSSNESNSGPLFSRRNHFCANLPHLFNVWYIFMSSNNKARDLKVGHPHRKQQQNILCRDLCNNQYDQFNISKDLLLLHDFAEKEKNWLFFYQLCIIVWYILKHRPFPACLCFCLPRGQRVDLTQRLPLWHLITPRQLDIG